VVAFTGVRRGEAMGLQWKNIYLKNKTIKIERTRDHLGVRTPKTKNSYRTLLVDDLVIQQLENYQKWCKKLLFTYGQKLTDETFVFISDHGAGPISNFKRPLERILARTTLPKITLHGLRHTHCTILMNLGLNVKVIAERLGNTVEMVYKIYGHVLAELEVESVSLFSQSLQANGANFGAGIN